MLECTSCLLNDCNYQVSLGEHPDFSTQGQESSGSVSVLERGKMPNKIDYHMSPCIGPRAMIFPT